VERLMRDRVLREAGGVALVLGSVLVAVALLSHSPMDPSPFHASTERTNPANWAGWLGATLSAALLSLIGLTALLLPPIGAVFGWRVVRQRPLENPSLTVIGWLIIVLSLPGLVSLAALDLPYRGGVVPSAGFVGRAASDLLGGFAGPVGRLVILAFCLLVGVLMVSGNSVATLAEAVAARVRERLEGRRRERLREKRERQQQQDRRKVLERQLARIDTEGSFRGPLTVKQVEGKGRFRIVRRPAGGAEAPPPVEDPKPLPTVTPEPAPAKRPAKARAEKKPAPEQPEKVVQEEFDFVEDLEAYDLPRISFLDEPPESAQRDSSAMIEMSKLITTKCHEFRVRGEVVNIRTGPVITTYEFRLEPGVKISAVQNLAEDLALALRTESVRIERIPGRATVGIEVPNPDPEVIRLRTLLEAPEFQHAQSLLTLSLGVDIRGKPFYADLARMPHLLIGGFTGSGKSVGLNAMIMSVLYKAKPDQVKFILVDPKMVELGVYADIPHLLTPIISDPKKAANALGWTVAEMDLRYRYLAALGARNLTQYNQLVSDPVQLRKVRAQLADADDEELAELEPMPYVVVVIDELADLMLASSRAVEESITRLSQKARAVGIHLVCATQRPSVDILTGIIKANFPCRLSYKVRSRFDARTILDSMGSEQLLGRGDMLYLPPGSSNLIRLHGPLVTEKEIATVVRYIKRFGKPDYQREVLTHAALGSNDKGGRRTVVEDEGELGDPMYEHAARLVVKTRKASASYIQRRLHLGYTRSARLLDMMEREGLVGPLAGSKGREVLVPENYFSEVDETHELVGDDDESEVTQ
jgi:S-DNA-T family DNA segregation ATPase FtsK/SpoIIIE